MADKKKHDLVGNILIGAAIGSGVGTSAGIANKVATIVSNEDDLAYKLIPYYKEDIINRADNIAIAATLGGGALGALGGAGLAVRRKRKDSHTEQVARDSNTPKSIG